MIKRANSQLLLGLLFILLSVAIVAGCGGSMNTMNANNRVLLSMSISPASADAQMFTNGLVTFTATGTFSQPPSPAMVTFVAPFSGSWEVSDPNMATITPNGMAQCLPGANGKVTVQAQASSNSATTPGAMSTAVGATATLTCP